MTKFRDGFMMKSPIAAHDAIMAEMKAKSKESSGRDDAPDLSNAEVVKLKKEYDKAKAEHDSPASMSPLNQGGYVGGGMSASDYQPTADLYMNMFKGIAEGAEKYDALEAERKKNKKENKESLFKADGTPKTTFDEKYNKTNKLKIGQIDTSKYF